MLLIMERADYSKRFAATLTDLILSFIVFMLYTHFTGAELLWTEPNDGSMQQTVVLGKNIRFLFVVFSFCQLTELVFAKSPGKAFHGLIIRNNSSSSSNLGQLGFRWAIKYGMLIVIWVPGLIGVKLPILGEVTGIWFQVLFFGTFLALFASKQCLHDKLSGTAVFCVEKNT